LGLGRGGKANNHRTDNQQPRKRKKVGVHSLDPVLR
jgi:hypothetical protein